MIVVMEPNTTKNQVRTVAAHVEALGRKATVIDGTERTVIAAIGDNREALKESLESSPGVSMATPISAPYKMASGEVRPDPPNAMSDGYQSQTFDEFAKTWNAAKKFMQR